MVSVNTAPLRRPPTASPITVTTGSRALRRPWRNMTGRVHPLGVGGTDVVLAEHLEQAGARHARDDRHWNGGERDRGQDQVSGGVDEQVELARYEAIDGVHVGQERKDRVGHPAQILQSPCLLDSLELKAWCQAPDGGSANGVPSGSPQTYRPGAGLEQRPGSIRRGCRTPWSRRPPRSCVDRQRRCPAGPPPRSPRTGRRW